MYSVTWNTEKLIWVAGSYHSTYRLSYIQHIVRCHLALDISHWRLRCSRELLLFPDGSAEMPPVWNDGAGENAPLCCEEIAPRHHGRHIRRRRRNIPPVRCVIRNVRPYLFTGVIGLSGMNGQAHMGGSKWFGTAWMTMRLTLRVDTSLSLCVIWNEGRAQCSPCIYHAALATIINLTCHLPQLHNHLHL